MLKKISSANLPTHYGSFVIHVFHNDAGQEVVALLKEPLAQAPLVRIHSSCMTGDIFGSKRCDCGDQLHQALELIDQLGGILIYLSQEGRGIGLAEKIRAYDLQEQGYDTVEANVKLGYPVDERYYTDAIAVLEFFGIKCLKLLTNNPEKITALQGAGFSVERQSLIIAPIPENEKYLATKQQKLGHLLHD
jgi:GTP cyclohydrolase II